MGTDKKDCMFQYGFRDGTLVENTGLISREYADALWEKYQGHIKDNWHRKPQMCIWVDCASETDYHTAERDIDWNDCELSGGNFYRVTKTRERI
jgi:hypothetical protein